MNKYELIGRLVTDHNGYTINTNKTYPIHIRIEGVGNFGFIGNRLNISSYGSAALAESILGEPSGYDKMKDREYPYWDLEAV